jgi:hypothetical protein
MSFVMGAPRSTPQPIAALHSQETNRSMWIKWRRGLQTKILEIAKNDVRSYPAQIRIYFVFNFPAFANVRHKITIIFINL